MLKSISIRAENRVELVSKSNKILSKFTKNNIVSTSYAIDEYSNHYMFIIVDTTIGGLEYDAMCV